MARAAEYPRPRLRLSVRSQPRFRVRVRSFSCSTQFTDQGDLNTAGPAPVSIAVWESLRASEQLDALSLFLQGCPRSEKKIEDRDAELSGTAESGRGLRIHCCVMSHGRDVLEAALKWMVGEDGMTTATLE